MPPSKKPCNVLMLVENGPYIADVRLKQEIKALTKAGYQVSVVCQRRKGGPFHEVIDGVHIYTFPMPNHTGGVWGYLVEFGYGLVIMFILSLIVWLRHGVDIVHAQNPPDILFPIGAFFKLFGKKFIFDHRDLSPELYLMRFPEKADSLLYKLLMLCERNSCRLTDLILATNTSYRKIVTERHNISPAKVKVVRNGPDSSTRPVEPDPELREKASIVIGYVGVMGPQDGVDYLIWALHHLAYDLNQPDFFCVLIGQGHTVDNLKALARELKLENHVWFTGFIARQKLLSYLSTADICIQPDPSGPLNDVSTMTKTMEYMILGKPVVAFDLPETRHTGGDTILYASPNDVKEMACQIARLMKDANLRSQLGSRGRERIQSGFTWEHSVVNLLNAYKTLKV